MARRWSRAAIGLREPNAWAAAILRNELDACLLERTANRHAIRNGGGWYAVLSFRPADSRYSHARRDSQIFSAPTYQRPGGSYLSTRDLFHIT